MSRLRQATIEARKTVNSVNATETARTMGYDNNTQQTLINKQSSTNIKVPTDDERARTGERRAREYQS